MMRKILVGLMVILVVGYLLTGVVLVRPGERAVVRRFGRVLEEKPGPGLWVGLPWGMDRVDRIEVERIRRVEVGYQQNSDPGFSGVPPGQLLTGDHNLVNVQVAIDYTIYPGEVEEYMVMSDQVESLIARTTDTVLSEWVGSRTVDEILVTGKTVLPQMVGQQVQKRLAPYRLGIQVHGTSVGYLAPPDEVKHAFDAVTQAHTKIGTRINEANERGVQQIRAAEQKKFHIEQQAAAYVSEQRRLAEADAAAFENRLEMYHKLRKENPDYLAGIWWDEMGKLFTQLQRNGQIDFLDRHLSADGLDITIMPSVPKRR